MTQVNSGELGQLRGSRIGHEQPRSVLSDIFLDPPRDDGMALGGVGADDKNDLGLGDVGDRVAHGPVAKRCQRGHNCGCVAKPCTVVDIVGSEHRPGKLLKQVIFFVGTLCRCENAQGVGTVAVADLPQSSRHGVKCFFPARRSKNLRYWGGIGGADDARHTFSADQGAGQPVRMVDEIEPVTPLDTKTSTVDRAVFISLDAYDAIFANAHLQGATHSAKGADGFRLAVRPH